MEANMRTSDGIIFKAAVSVALACLVAGCASQITTANSVVTTVCDTSQPAMMASLREVVGGMNHYRFTAQSETDALVKYDPSNPVMGSATIRVHVAQASGTTREGQRLGGVELIYTDVTPLMSQDTSFGGGDIINQLKSAVDEYAKFQGLACTVVKRY
jgi:hypothetical protein